MCTTVSVLHHWTAFGTTAYDVLTQRYDLVDGTDGIGEVCEPAHEATVTCN